MEELDRAVLDGINWQDSRQSQVVQPKPVQPPPRAPQEDPPKKPPEQQVRKRLNQPRDPIPPEPQRQPAPAPPAPQPGQSSVQSQPISPVNHANKPSPMTVHSLRPLTIRGTPANVQPQNVQPATNTAVVAPLRLSQARMQPVEILPTRRPRQPASELSEAKDTLHRLAEEEIKELEAKNKELTKKNTDLKNSNGKLGIAYMLLATELSRLEFAGVTRLEEKSAVNIPPLDIQSAQNRELKKLRDENERLSRMLEESRRIIDDLKSLQEAQKAQAAESKGFDTQSRLKELGKNEEIEMLRRDNTLLRDRLSEVGLLKNELENLRRKLQSYEESQRGVSVEDVDRLREENKDLRRRLEEYKQKNQLSNDRLREDNERLLTALEKDKRVIGNMDYELKKLGIEKENLEDELRSLNQKHQLEIEKLKAKIEKRESAKRDLEQLIKELQRYKTEKEDSESKRGKKLEETMAQNQFLKQELESITNELEALRKLYLEQNKRQSQSSKNPNATTAPIRKHSGSGSSRNSPKAERHTISTLVPEPPKRTYEAATPSSMPPLEKFLLSLEIYRLHFAYLNCRCKQPCSDVCQLELSPSKENRLRMRSSERRDASPSMLRSPSANAMIHQGEVAILMREKDNLKLVLADYQKKLLEARRQLDAMRENAKENRAGLANTDFKATNDTSGTHAAGGRSSTGINARELELQIKVLMAENARLSNLLARSRA